MSAIGDLEKYTGFMRGLASRIRASIAERKELRRRLARALWRIRRERHFFEDGVEVYSENLSNAMDEERHELAMRRKQKGDS